MVDRHIYDDRYWSGNLPVVWMDFEHGDGTAARSYPALLDSGSPLGFLPRKLRRKLELIRGPRLPYPFAIAGVRIENPQTYLGRVRVQGVRINGLMFIDWPASSINNFRRLRKSWHHPTLPPFALVGTDAFRSLLVAVDHKESRVFLGGRMEQVTRDVVDQLELVSDPTVRPRSVDWS